MSERGSKWVELKIRVNSEYVEPTVRLFHKCLSENVFTQIIDFNEESRSENELDVEVIGYILSDQNFSESLTNLQVGLKLFEKIFLMSDLEMKEVFSDTWEKQEFPPIKIGRDIVIVAKNKDKKNFPDKLSLVIEPSMAFGTGHHVTTKMCIEFIEHYIKGYESVIDLGTGSGILALCSLLLGSKKVYCVDNDIEAINSAKNNFRESGFISKSKFFHGNLFEIPVKSEKFDLVLANLTSSILIENFKVISNMVSKNGIVIMSGILASRFNEVIKIYLNENFKLLNKLQNGNWISVVLKG